jgi:hypothetical protein
MKIRWHYPAFWTLDDAETDAEFNSQAELLQLPRVRLLTTEPEFARWEVSEHDDCDFLMLILKDGTFWVTGYLPKDHGLDFPRWVAPARCD